jgi:hypothetical protein
VKQASGVSFIYREKALGKESLARERSCPGKPEASEIMVRVQSDDEDERMPPADHGDGKPLAEKEIATLRQWIAEGAKWGEHWAYVKPQPQVVPPVKDASWARCDADRFILAQLEAERFETIAVRRCGAMASGV